MRECVDFGRKVNNKHKVPLLGVFRGPFLFISTTWGVFSELENSQGSKVFLSQLKATPFIPINQFGEYDWDKYGRHNGSSDSQSQDSAIGNDEEVNNTPHTGNKMCDQLEALKGDTLAKREHLRKVTITNENLKKSAIKLDEEFVAISTQLEEIELLEQSQEELLPEQKNKMSRKVSLNTQKSIKMTKQAAIKKETKQTELAVKNAKEAVETAEREFNLIKSFCQKTLGVDRLAMGQSTPKRRKIAFKPKNLMHAFNQCATEGDDNNSIPDELVAISGSGAIPSECVNGVNLPSFILKTKAYRTPDLIMRDLAELVKNPAFFEVSLS